MNSPHESASNRSGRKQVPSEEDLVHIRDSLQGLLFGSITIILQDGCIVQIDRLEKRRLVNHQKRAAP